MVIFNEYLSVAVPQTLISFDRKRIAQQILALFKFQSRSIRLKTSRVLDVGSSSGEVSSHLVGMKKIICLDIDQNALKLGRKKFAHLKNLSFLKFDGVNIPYPDNSFDLIILRRVIECAQKPQLLIDEVFRVLKPQGLIYFESHNIIWPDPNWDFWVFVPSKIKKFFINLAGKKAYYIANYRNYWQLKKIFSKFDLSLQTAHILKNPKQFKFEKLYKLNEITKFIPLTILKLSEPVYPAFIWILKKPFS